MNKANHSPQIMSRNSDYKNEKREEKSPHDDKTKNSSSWINIAAHRKEWKERSEKKRKENNLEREAREMYKEDLLEKEDWKRVRQLNSEYKHYWPKMEEGVASQLERIFSHKQATVTRQLALLIHCDSLITDNSQTWKLILTYLRKQFYVILVLKGTGNNNRQTVKQLLEQQYSFDMVYSSKKGSVPILVDYSRLQNDLRSESILAIVTLKSTHLDTDLLVPLVNHRVRLITILMQSEALPIKKRQLVRLPDHIKRVILD